MPSIKVPFRLLRGLAPVQLLQTKDCLLDRLCKGRMVYDKETSLFVGMYVQISFK
jgi:hypothetical protein